MYFHKPCCAGSAAGSFEFQVWTTQGFFGNTSLSEKQCCFLDHKAGFMVFLKTIKLAQLTHTNSYRVLQCPISLAQAKLHHCIRILKGLKQPFSWRAYLNN